MFKRDKQQKYNPVIAKGKRREFIKDAVYEFGESIFEAILERWKEILISVGVVLGVVLVVSLVLHRMKQKKIEDFLNFERAYSIITMSPTDASQIENALNIMRNVKEPKYISKIYKAWMLFKLQRREEAIDELTQIIEDEKAPHDIRKIAAIMKINVLGKTNCKETIETYHKFLSLLPPQGMLRSEETKGYISTLPIRTYFEVARCAKDKPDMIQRILADLDAMYVVEQFLSQDRAKNILIAKEVINKIVTEDDVPR